MLGLKQYAGAGAAGPEHPPAAHRLLWWSRVGWTWVAAGRVPVRGPLRTEDSLWTSLKSGRGGAGVAAASISTRSCGCFAPITWLAKQPERTGRKTGLPEGGPWAPPAVAGSCLSSPPHVGCPAIFSPPLCRSPRRRQVQKSRVGEGSLQESQWWGKVVRRDPAAAAAARVLGRGASLKELVLSPRHDETSSRHWSKMCDKLWKPDLFV